MMNSLGVLSGLLIVILLDIVVIFNIIEFAKFSKLSAKLLIPYLLFWGIAVFPWWVHILTSNVLEFQFLNILANVCYFLGIFFFFW